MPVSFNPFSAYFWTQKCRFWSSEHRVFSNSFLLAAGLLPALLRQKKIPLRRRPLVQDASDNVSNDMSSDPKPKKDSEQKDVNIEHVIDEKFAKVEASNTEAYESGKVPPKTVTTSAASSAPASAPPPGRVSNGMFSFISFSSFLLDTNLSEIFLITFF